MLFQDISILDEEYRIREHMWVAVEGTHITYVGDHAPEGDFGQVYNGTDRLLMPAFYNAHAHSPMMLMRGYGENLSLQDWLNTRIFPFEDKLTGEAVYYSTLLAMAESLRVGIVSSSDMYYFCEDMVRAVEKSGAKANISRSIVSFGEGSVQQMPSFREAEEFIRRYHGAADGRILADASIHAEYTNTVTSMTEVAALARQYGVNMHVHVSETKDEHEACKARHGGRTPTELLRDLGAFDTPAIAAHCVWAEEKDMDIFLEKGVTVATCPVSNLKLASGVCNVPALLEKGVNVAIGTDSVASNNSLNFVEEMKFFALLNKGWRGDPTVVTPTQTLRAASRAGALAQGRRDCGVIAEGYRADLTVLDISQPHMKPVHDLVNNVVYSASGSDVVLTMADGRVLYRDGEYLTIDIEETVRKTEEACRDILSRL